MAMLASKKNKIPLKAIAITFAVIGVVLLASALVMLLIPKNTVYEHRDVSGVICEAKRQGTRYVSYEFKLDGDNNTYWVDNIAYKKVNGNIENALKKGNTVKIKIAETDDSGRKRISYIECDGVVYLSVNDFEKAHRTNYTVGCVMMFIFSGATFTLSISYAVMHKKQQRGNSR